MNIIIQMREAAGPDADADHLEVRRRADEVVRHSDRQRGEVAPTDDVLNPIDLDDPLAFPD